MACYSFVLADLLIDLNEALVPTDFRRTGCVPRRYDRSSYLLSVANRDVYLVSTFKFWRIAYFIFYVDITLFGFSRAGEMSLKCFLFM